MVDKDKLAFYILGGLLVICGAATVTIATIGMLFWK